MPIVLLLFESQRCVLSPLVSDWLCWVSCFYLFIYLVFPLCSIFLFFGFWCSLFRWFYNFVVPKLFSSNVLIVVLTSFVFLFILMLYNIILDIFPVHCTSLRLVLINSDVTLVKVKTFEANLVVAPQDPSTFWEISCIHFLLVSAWTKSAFVHHSLSQSNYCIQTKGVGTECVHDN